MYSVCIIAIPDKQVLFASFTSYIVCTCTCTLYIHCTCIYIHVHTCAYSDWIGIDEEEMFSDCVRLREDPVVQHVFIVWVLCCVE